MPAGPGAFTGQLDYNHFDGDITFASLPNQNDYLLEVGYLIPALNLTPVLQFSDKNVVDTTKGNENHSSIGLNYWWAAHKTPTSKRPTRASARPDRPIRTSSRFSYSSFASDAG